jgi:glycosyltransferase involved in cell wall biosynthesis
LAIGSFQKDGVGWADGLEPKLIKGPDLLLDAVGKLARHFPLHVLLTGPARGYVKRGLDALGIPYSHEYLQDYRDLPNAYHALDLYLVTSREEGGPKAVLEGAATGIPVVSSRVGMAPDVIAHGHTGCLVDVGDTTATVTEAAALLGDADLRMAVGAAARSAIAPYDWSHIGDRHLERVYTPLLDGTTS